MAGWLKDAQINTDRNLKLQYLAGLGLNLYQSDPIYKAMIRESKYPEELFAGSPRRSTRCGRGSPRRSAARRSERPGLWPFASSLAQRPEPDG